jgi:hypothetical protein
VTKTPATAARHPRRGPLLLVTEKTAHGEKETVSNGISSIAAAPPTCMLISCVLAEAQ